jgi:hypothetical protein
VTRQLAQGVVQVMLTGAFIGGLTLAIIAGSEAAWQRRFRAHEPGEVQHRRHEAQRAKDNADELYQRILIHRGMV